MDCSNRYLFVGPDKEMDKNVSSKNLTKYENE